MAGSAQGGIPNVNQAAAQGVYGAGQGAVRRRTPRSLTIKLESTGTFRNLPVDFSLLL